MGYSMKIYFFNATFVLTKTTAALFLVHQIVLLKIGELCRYPAKIWHFKYFDAEDK